MRLEQVSDRCFAVLSPSNRLCDANSGFIHSGGGAIVDTQSDEGHARQLRVLARSLAPQPPRWVINTHEDADHVWGNNCFPDSEIVAHQRIPERMKEVADPAKIQQLMQGVQSWFAGPLLRVTRPGLWTVGKQLQRSFDFRSVTLRLPDVLFEDRMELDLEGLAVHLIHVGPCHQVGDTIVHVPEEGVIYSGDIIFNECTPIGWAGTCENWLNCLELIRGLQPKAIVPGHGPVCGLEGVERMRAYLSFMIDAAKTCFDQGLSELDAAKQIDVSEFADLHGPARLYLNIARAYREFRGESLEGPWDIASVFESIYRVARAKGLTTEF